jgi:hypothetical protein
MGPTDNVGAVPAVDIGIVTGGYRQAVQGDPMRRCCIPRIRRRQLAGVLPPVTRHVDDLAAGDKRLGRQETLGGGDTAAGLGHRMHPGARGAAKASCQCGELAVAVNDGPRQHDALFLSPLDHGYFDSLIDPARDRRREVVALQRRGDALPLQLEAIVINRAGNVDCQHQSHIGSIGSGGCAKRHSPGDGQNRREPRTSHSPFRSG